MSAQPNMASGKSEMAARAASAHPLRAISFSNPAVVVDRRDDGTIYLGRELRSANIRFD